MTALLLGVLALVSVAAAGGLSAIEAGVVSVNRIRLRHLVKSGDPRARRLARLLKGRERVFVAAGAGGSLFVAVAASLATAALGTSGSSRLVWPVVIVLTPLTYVVGRAAPRWYVRGRADTAMLHGAGLLAFVCALLSPLAAAVSWFARGLFRICRRPPRAIFPTREELQSVPAERGRLDPGRKRVEAMLGGLFKFGLTTAREVMIPMPDVVAVEENATVEELLALVRCEGHTRIPVFQGRVDQVIGFANVFDVLYDEAPKSAVRDYLRPIPVTPDTKRIDRLMVELQRQREAMAVVVNEFGACIGIVSLEDIIEEIMGEMTDEHEEDERRILVISPGVYDVDAKADIDDLNEELGLDLPKDGYETLAGLLLKRFGRIPRIGDATAVPGARFEVLDVYRYGIRRVRLTLGGDPGAPG
jgi:CBS domain containing-hemolysin-like protein